MVEDPIKSAVDKVVGREAGGTTPREYLLYMFGIFAGATIASLLALVIVFFDVGPPFARYWSFTIVGLVTVACGFVTAWLAGRVRRRA